MWYFILRFLVRLIPREKLEQYIHERLEIVTLDEFDEKDQKQIEDWLSMSARMRGYHAYFKARDRKIAQLIVSLPVNTEQERSLFAQTKGARLELVRLYNRGNHLHAKQERERRRKQDE